MRFPLLVLLHFVLLSVRADGQHLGGKIASDGFTTISSDFHRTLRTPRSEESIAGTFHYLGSGHIYFEVIAPLHQIVTIDADETIIYYPDRKSGFRFLGQGGIQILPMLPGILAATRSDYGIGDLGFSMYDQKVDSDTLLTFWRNEEFGDKVGEFRLAIENGKLAYVVYSPPSSPAEIRTTFSNYTAIGDMEVPLTLETRSMTDSGRSVGTLLLSGLKFDGLIPEYVRTFKPPEDALIEERNW